MIIVLSFYIFIYNKEQNMLTYCMYGWCRAVMVCQDGMGPEALKDARVHQAHIPHLTLQWLWKGKRVKEWVQLGC